MKILWITNTPIAKHREMLGIPMGQSGGWMEASYTAIKNNVSITLGVVTLYNGPDIIKGFDLHHVFYLIPCKEGVAKYKLNSNYNKQMWRTVLDEFKPDCIHLWGSEFSHGLCALQLARGVPSVLYVQGLMSQIANHSFAGMSFYERIMSTSIVDIIKRQTYWAEYRNNLRRANNENNIIALVNGVIAENEWCFNNIKVLSDKCLFFKSLLPVNSLFLSYSWSLKTMTPYTIFTTAGANPIKGHHFLLKALSLVVKRYPQTKLIIPGENYYFQKGFKRAILRNSFPSYLMRLIKKYSLSENVFFIGKLTPEQMAQQMQSCNVFVMPSAIENHSSTLIEAMMVGAPSISSFVGGVNEYLDNAINGFLYRFDEPEVMASLVIKIFENPKIAEQISNNAKSKMFSSRAKVDINNDFVVAYRRLLDNGIE